MEYYCWIHCLYFLCNMHLGVSTRGHTGWALRGQGDFSGLRRTKSPKIICRFRKGARSGTACGRVVLAAYSLSTFQILLKYKCLCLWVRVTSGSETKLGYIPECWDGIQRRWLVSHAASPGNLAEDCGRSTRVVREFCSAVCCIIIALVSLPLKESYFVLLKSNTST